MDRSCFPLFISLAVLAFTGIAETRTCWDKTWHNTSVPLTNGSEFEGLLQTERNALCGNHAPIEAQCADSRLEGFKGNKSEPKLQYKASCDVDHGLICHPFPNTTVKCPDMSIQYGCDCQYTVPAGQIVSTTARSLATAKIQPAVVSTVLKQQTNKPGSGSTTPAGPNQNEKQQGGGGNGADRGQSALTLMTGFIVVIQYFFF